MLHVKFELVKKLYNIKTKGLIKKKKMILFTARYWLQSFIANENFDLNMKTLILKEHRQSN